MAWRQGHDGNTEEDVFLNKDDQPYIRTQGDVRIKYELRPESLDVMSLAQFATEYRMVRRTRGANAVPLLLFSGAVNRYSSRLLFQPWRELEAIRVDQQDLETATQRQTRLQLFPMSVFPICNDTIDDEEET